MSRRVAHQDLLGTDIASDPTIEERRGPRSESRLAILPNTTHVTLMERGDAIIPMVNDFLDAKSRKK